MSIISITRRNKAVLVRIEGVFSYDVFRKAMAEVLRSGSFCPGIDAIWDLRDADVDHLTADRIQGIAQHMQHIAAVRGPRWKTALVVTGDFYYGLGRMYMAYNENALRGLNEVMVFRNMGEAAEWVGGTGRQERVCLPGEQPVMPPAAVFA